MSEIWSSKILKPLNCHKKVFTKIISDRTRNFNAYIIIILFLVRKMFISRTEVKNVRRILNYIISKVILGGSLL